MGVANAEFDDDENAIHDSSVCADLLLRLRPSFAHGSTPRAIRGLAAMGGPRNFMVDSKGASNVDVLEGGDLIPDLATAIQSKARFASVK